MGDVVLATAALEPLRAAGYEISFVTKKQFAPLLEKHQALKATFAFDKSLGEKAAREALFSWVKERDFSLVLDLQDSWRTRLWRPRLKQTAKVKVARKERLREWLILYLRLGKWLGFGKGGRARKFRRLAEDALNEEGLFHPGAAALTRLELSNEEKKSVEALIPAGEFAVFLPGSAWKGKEWPYFPELARIFARKVPVVALGAEKDFVCDAIAEAASGHPASRSLRGQTDLRSSMAVAAAARWVIGNDTGMVHVAEALGKEVAMIEGPTHEWMGFSPYREGSLSLGLRLICRPCSKSGRVCVRAGTRKCLFGLSVAQVAGRLRGRGFPC
jgi:ADP-heptose:LPS heptosyltransferase